MFVALIPMQDVRLFELLMALAVKFLFEKILRKACTGLLVLDEVKKHFVRSCSLQACRHL